MCPLPSFFDPISHIDKKCCHLEINLVKVLINAWKEKCSNAGGIKIFRDNHQDVVG